jgi:O-acetylhomoserine (thiol)-lyase
VFSFDLKGSRKQGQAFIESLKIFSTWPTWATAAAGHPPGQHHALPHGRRALVAAGITPGTIRLSIGLEDADDLIDDLKRAFKVAEKAR